VDDFRAIDAERPDGHPALIAVLQRNIKGVESEK
jgi:hypothetical protein